MSDDLVGHRNGAEVVVENERLRAEIAALGKTLAEMIYETTHLSPQRDDGSHDCRISAATLAKARAALGGGG